jgi:hypothetical protein
MPQKAWPSLEKREEDRRRKGEKKEEENSGNQTKPDEVG